MKFYKQPWIGLAFSVFAVGNVYADTVIASKDYVDNAVGAKQDKLTTTNVITSGTGDVVTGVTASDGTVTVTKGSIDAVSNGDNALNLTSSTTKAPTVKAVQGSVLYVGNTASANTKTPSKAISSVSANANVFNTNSTIKADSDAYVPSVAAVEARIKGISITNSNVATGAGITTNKMGAITGYTKATTNAALAATDTLNTALGKLEKKADDADGVATSVKSHIANQGTYTVDWNNSTVTTSNDASKDSNLGAAKADQDTYIPTMAAVEQRVKTAETAASNALSNLTVTSAMIQDGTIAEADIGTGAVTNGKLGADAVTSDKIKNGEVKTNDIADLNVTTGKLAADAVTNAKLADNAVQTENVVDKSLKYQNDMNNPALYDINTGAVPASDVCTKTAPCMLTYYKEGGYVYTRWTPLDADGLSANAATTDKGASI
ncbi:MAG: hypothetical protein MJ164_03135 [Alphaproteobacteria bacterium]|nr:hypothetical protein [Alphaproteobacteria bacterium]